MLFSTSKIPVMPVIYFHGQKLKKKKKKEKNKNRSQRNTKLFKKCCNHSTFGIRGKEKSVSFHPPRKWKLENWKQILKLFYQIYPYGHWALFPSFVNSFFHSLVISGVAMKCWGYKTEK